MLQKEKQHAHSGLALRDGAECVNGASSGQSATKVLVAPRADEPRATASKQPCPPVQSRSLTELAQVTTMAAKAPEGSGIAKREDRHR
mmetsp:Transcript_55757/g.104945  ORF Transcript_55757/g.104945 Transcript_55757/m.104945 type:complete len:88 (-) Transcript_55757:70-333(-)